jgi:predicted tellurium resistance membrane protein TerC
MTEFLAPLFTAEGLVGLVTLLFMEIVLGIDNIIFIAIICGYIPDRKEQKRARTIGLMLALVFRIGLLFTISWIARMVNPLFFIGDFGVSGRDLILFAGGTFLIIKTIKELYHKFKDAEAHHTNQPTRKITMMQAILQIMIIDIVFSFDSIITAVGLSNQLVVMIAAVTGAMLVMLAFAPYVSDFINKYPTLKMLALAFLVVIGVVLVVESLHIHFDKSYVYVALGFSLLVELLNIRMHSLSHKKKNESH